MERVGVVNVIVSLLLGLVITGCLPPQPGIFVKIAPTATDCVSARNEVIELLSRWRHELIFAPDPKYPRDVSKYTFEGKWSNFGSAHGLGAVAIISNYPALTVSIFYDTRECNLSVALNYGKVVTVKDTQFSETEKQYAYELLSLLKGHYGEGRIKVVHMTGL